MGRDHEQERLTSNEREMQRTQDSFKVERCVVFISNEYPFIGASPDSVVECNCCGKGTVEIKCPYCVRDKVVADCVEKVTCLENEW